MSEHYELVRQILAEENLNGLDSIQRESELLENYSTDDLRAILGESPLV